MVLKKKIARQAQADIDRNKEYLDALHRYHVATGDEKERLKKILWPQGFTPLTYPDFSGLPPEEREKAASSYPWKRSHWRKKGREIGLDLFSYGESTFRTFLKKECLMSKVKEKLNTALWKAYRLNIVLTNEFNLKVDQGMYMPKDTRPGNPGSCHPLECVLLGEDCLEPDVALDVARFLEVPVEWVIGFIEGYEKIEPTADDPAHQEGYQLGLYLTENYEQVKEAHPARMFSLS